MVLETHRMRSYLRSEARLFFWRTNAGAEVDLLIEKHGRLLGAFEIKASRRIAGSNLSGLRAFHQDDPTVPLAIICDAAEPHMLEGVRVIPWKAYFEELPEILG